MPMVCHNFDIPNCNSTAVQVEFASKLTGYFMFNNILHELPIQFLAGTKKNYINEGKVMQQMND